MDDWSREDLDDSDDVLESVSSVPTDSVKSSSDLISASLSRLPQLNLLIQKLIQVCKKKRGRNDILEVMVDLNREINIATKESLAQVK